MAIVGTQLTIGGGPGAASQATASVAPTANALLLLDVIGANGGGGAPVAPTIAGNGLTWVQVATVTLTDGATETWRVTRFRAQGASPSTGVITITHSTAPDSTMGWALREYTGVVTTGTNGSDAVVQTVTNTGTGTAVSATLAAFGSAGNGADALTSAFGTPTVTPEAGWTGFTANTDGNTKRAQWRDDNDTTPSSTLSVSQPWAMIATEIQASGGGGSTAVSGEVSFSSFDLMAEISNVGGGVTVNASGELVFATFDLNVSEILAYITGETEITFNTFDTSGGLSGAITAVLASTIALGTEISLAAASTFQRIADAVIDLGTRLEGAITGGDPVIVAGTKLIKDGVEIVRRGASYVSDVMRSIIRRY